MQWCHPHCHWPQSGSPICLPHTCNLCGKSADEFVRLGLSCRSRQGRASRHQMLNNVIHCSLASPNIPSRLKPGGVTTVAWSNGRFLVWDATCVDTFCNSHHQATAKEAGWAAAHAETEKATYMFSLWPWQKTEVSHRRAQLFHLPPPADLCGNPGWQFDFSPWGLSQTLVLRLHISVYFVSV